MRPIHSCIFFQLHLNYYTWMQVQSVRRQLDLTRVEVLPGEYNRVDGVRVEIRNVPGMQNTKEVQWVGKKTELERNFLKEKGENALEVVTGRKDNSLVFRPSLWLPHFSCPYLRIECQQQSLKLVLNRTRHHFLIGMRILRVQTRFRDKIRKRVLQYPQRSILLSVLKSQLTLAQVLLQLVENKMYYFTFIYLVQLEPSLQEAVVST